MHYDVLYRGGQIYSTAYRRFFYGFFALLGGKFAHIADGDPGPEVEADRVVELCGRRVVPGLIDIHTHIESSMLTPVAFAEEQCRRGVTTIVSEPHEIANVAGVDGVLAMMEAGEGAPCDIYYGIPSSVPASAPELETTGGVIGAEELKALAANDRVRCLGEVMNQRSVIDEPNGRSNTLIAEFRRLRPDLPVEGHCPRTMGERLSALVSAGVDSDHTEHSFQEFVSRYRMGMTVELQEKCISRELMEHITENSLFASTALVTDDVMPDELVEHGALDYVLKLAVNAGYPLNDAIYSATKVPAVRMRFYDRGEIKPGCLADFSVLEDSEVFSPLEVIKRGEPVYRRGDSRRTGHHGFPERFYNSLRLEPVSEADFRLPAKGPTLCRVIGVDPNRTQTEELHELVPAEGGELLYGRGGPILAAVFERYGRTGGGRAYGLIGGSAHRRGAVAATYCHDHHNLFVAGENAADMALAANRVRELCGGFAVALGGEIIAEIPLPVGGIMSDLSVGEAGGMIARVTAAMRELGYRHEDPIMSFCTIPLTVSPALKISDRGLVDVAAGRIVPLFM